MGRDKPAFKKADAVTSAKDRTRNGVIVEVLGANERGVFRYKVVWPADRMRETEELETDLVPLKGGSGGRHHVTNVFKGTVHGKLTQSGDGTFLFDE